MMPIFLNPYSDESIQNVFSRYHKISGNLKIKHTYYDLFEKEIYFRNTYFPSHLHNFCTNFNNAELKKVEYWIRNHTIIPIFKPFLANELYQKIIDEISGNSSKYSKLSHTLIINKISQIGGFNYCEQCRGEDISLYGEAYFHRTHQIPGYIICTKHKMSLYQYIPQYNEDIHLPNINDYNLKNSIMLCSFIIGDEESEMLSGIAKDIEYIVENYMHLPSLGYIQKKYRDLLYRKGFMSFDGKIYQAKLCKEFKIFYKDHFLDNLFLNFKVDDIPNNWLTNLTTGYSKMIQPLKYILFIRFLCGSFEKFISTKLTSLKPFGDSPWPCLNPASEHYKKDVIYNYEISPNSTPVSPLGIFKCSCGYIYSRLGPDKVYEDRFLAKKIIQRGEIWESLLKEKIYAKNYSIRRLAEIMNCDKATICRYAYKLGLSEQINSEVRFKIGDGIGRKKNPNLEETYISVVKNYIATYPDCRKSQIVKALTKECSWLRRNKKELYAEIMPKPINKIGRDLRIKKTKVNWSERDKFISEEIPRIVEEIKKEDIPIKISIAALNKKLEISLYGKLKKMPKTRKVIEMCVESDEQFHTRKLDHVINTMQKNNERLVYYIIVDKAGLRSTISDKNRGYVYNRINKIKS